MEIIYYKELVSTHKFLLKKLKSNKINNPIMIIADEQSGGIGTYNREWKSYKGNLFLSFSDSIDSLPLDLPLQSISIYFAYLLKEVLAKKGSKVWIKWPNDFYIDDKKIGGVLSQIVGKRYICSIGLNLKVAPKGFKIIDINIDRDEIIYLFNEALKKVFTWKSIFSKYQIEFIKSKDFVASIDGRKVPLKGAYLQADGSIIINNKKVYSQR